jgi:disulfide bond formation protein DsbB
MHSQDTNSGLWRQRALALVACLALLYFAGGGSLLHQHTGGPETPCHVCQALHMPALAVAPVKLIPAAQQVAWHEVLPQHVTPTDSFALHRASRAPPLA